MEHLFNWYVFDFLSSKKSLDSYRFPVYTTKLCPQNQNEWKKRSSSLNYSGSSYLCFPNEDLTELLGFCYDTNRTHITPSKKNNEIHFSPENYYRQISNVSYRDKITMLQISIIYWTMEKILTSMYLLKEHVCIYTGDIQFWMATTAPDSHMGVQVPLISAMKSISVILLSNV